MGGHAVTSRRVFYESFYWRARKVFETFGPIVDSATGKPLFNAAAWKKADNVLAEILAGYASDPPGVDFYSYRMDARGEPKLDTLGNPLLDCSRGSNDTECAHKQIVTTFGTWAAGVRMTDALLREWRHRYNQGVSERRRLGFPKLGFYDTWLVDSYQLLVEANHGGMLVYPEWSNATDFEATREKFGTVALHSPRLGDAIEAIEVNMAEVKLTSDQKYMCKAMGTKLPILPVHGPAENKLFATLAAELASPLNFDDMAISWCAHVDGTTVFPKLPVYLRLHHTTWLRNVRIRDTLAREAVPLEQLRQRLAADQSSHLHRCAPSRSHRSACRSCTEPR